MCSQLFIRFSFFRVCCLDRKDGMGAALSFISVHRIKFSLEANDTKYSWWFHEIRNENILCVVFIVVVFFGCFCCVFATAADVPNQSKLLLFSLCAYIFYCVDHCLSFIYHLIFIWALVFIAQISIILKILMKYRFLHIFCAVNGKDEQWMQVNKKKVNSSSRNESTYCIKSAFRSYVLTPIGFPRLNFLISLITHGLCAFRFLLQRKQHKNRD